MFNIKKSIEMLSYNKIKKLIEKVLAHENNEYNKTKNNIIFASDFMINTCQGMSLKITDKYEILYECKSNWLFIQDFKNMKLWYNYNKIYLVLKNEYKIEPNDINEFIKDWIALNLKWYDLTPSVLFSTEALGLSTDLNLYESDKLNLK